MTAPDTVGSSNITLDRRAPSRHDSTSRQTHQNPEKIIAARKAPNSGDSWAMLRPGSWSFVYNGADDRVAMTNGVGTRRFVYDADGRVLGEYGVSATDVHAEYIWALPSIANDNAPFGGDDGVGGYAPLAVATPDTGGTVVIN